MIALIWGTVGGVLFFMGWFIGRYQGYVWGYQVGKLNATQQYARKIMGLAALAREDEYDR